MPKLSPKQFAEELSKEGTLSNEEFYNQKIIDQEDNKKDTLRVLGCVQEPYVKWHYDAYTDTEKPQIGYHYQIGVEDITNHQKYLITLGENIEHNLMNGMMVQKMDTEPEYTHFSKQKTMISGLSVNPDTLAPSQDLYFREAGKRRESAYQLDGDRVIEANYRTYEVFENHAPDYIYNNIFYVEKYEAHDFENDIDYPAVAVDVNLKLFDITPEMAKKIEQQAKKLELDALYLPREKAAKKEYLEQKKSVYRALNRIENKKKNKEKKQMAKEIKMYREERGANVSQSLKATEKNKVIRRR
jgi:hypothetical protein